MKKPQSDDEMTSYVKLECGMDLEVCFISFLFQRPFLQILVFKHSKAFEGYGESSSAIIEIFDRRCVLLGERHQSKGLVLEDDGDRRTGCWRKNVDRGWPLETCADPKIRLWR